MAKEEDVEWMKAAEEMFDGALYEHDIPRMRNIIADVMDKGFSVEGQYMNSRLNKLVSQQHD